jgi:A/G-specific adenine glycosylase
MPPSSRDLAFKRRLLQWFRRHARPLPWRGTRDPYAVLVSEVMLQQTQVSRVLDFYPRFLGYYRRAANLHALAHTVVRDHAGAIPTDPADLERLPGVGRYTAGAVAAFAYERRVPAVDTNVRRVLGRVFAPGTKGRRGGDREPQLWALAERLLPRSRRAAWEFNQALMDLGATICGARKPKCEVCPVRPACRTGNRNRDTGTEERAARRVQGAARSGKRERGHGKRA